VNNALNNLNLQLNDSFKDGIITEVELKNIENTLAQIDREYYDIDKMYMELYNNNNLDTEVETNRGKMWIGYIPYDERGAYGFNSLDQIGVNITMNEIQFGLNMGTIREFSPKTLDKMSVGIVPTSCYVCCIYPKSNKYSVTIDNGIGGKETFSEKHGDLPINGLRLNTQIEGVDYLISGFLVSMEGERFLYVD
jgi:hypothetical protein